MRFTRLELAGSLGDLGTLLPLAMGMILINGLSPSGIFFSAGLFYIASGLYFKVPTAVQPMKVISAYAVASALSAQQIQAATLIMALVLLGVGASGAMAWISRHTPKTVIRGVQLSTGILLMAEGIKCMLGNNTLQLLRQVSEPYLAVQAIGPLPIGILIGVAGVVLTLLLLNNSKFPAALVIIGFGIVTGLVFGAFKEVADVGLQINLPELLPLGLPGRIDLTFAFFALVLPQIPMTLGNAVLANADLSGELFGEASGRVTGKALCISMAIANLGAFMWGGMPMCHGAGGLAAHFRFGARTAGSNLIIGIFMVVLVLVVGDQIVALFHLIPLAVLGVLLLFAGSQLALTLVDLSTRAELFITLTMLGVTLATNLAVGFAAGLALAMLLRWTKIEI